MQTIFTTNNKMNNKIKNIFIITLFSLSYLPIWGLLLLDADTSDNFSVFVGILYSILSIYFIKNTESVKSTKYGNVYLYAFPVFYLIACIALLEMNYYFLLNPILWAFMTLIVGSIAIKSINNKELFFIIFISYFYAYHLHPTFKNQVEEEKLSVEAIEEKNLQLSKNLQTYFFENGSNDTIKLNTEKQFILIETWNEKCPPCLSAMKDLQPLLDTLSPLVDHYYLYENGSQKLYMEKSKIYSFPNIINKSKIIMDIQNSFFKDSQMDSFPYFLLFDNKGNLLDYFKGYDKRYKDYFVKRIKKMVNR